MRAKSEYPLRHADQHLPWGSDPIDFPTSSGTRPFADFISNGATAVPDSSSTIVGFYNAIGIYTNDPVTFTIDLLSGANYGVGIHAPGYYMFDWTVTVYDRSGHRVPTPQVEQIYAEDGSGTNLLTGMFLGSNFSYGKTIPGGSPFGQWDIVWSRTSVVLSDTGAAPVIANVIQNTGETLDAYVFAHVEQLTTDTMGF